MRRMIRSAKSFLSTFIFLALVSLPALALAGPVVLMGIDGEDGNGASGSSHGGKAPYISVASSFIAATTNGGTGILVIGGGKSPTDDVTGFWNAIGVGVGETTTNVNGAAGIAAQSFAGFRMIAVASSSSDTPGGGLTEAENNALSARAADVAAFVNGGGGLFGLSQGGLSDPYGYLGQFGGGVTSSTTSYSAVTATPEGLAVGITDTNMDVCCWHNEYLTFPSFLDVLATNDGSGLPAAIGGLDITIAGQITLAPEIDLNPLGTDHTVSATVLEGEAPFDPLVGVDVDFEVISGPNVGDMGTDTTDAFGIATFTYTGDGGAGVDVIEATFVDPTTMGTITSNQILKFWDTDCQPNGIADTCDIDCNGFGGQCNAILGCGTSDDANTDGVPDDCSACGCMDVAFVVDDTGSMGGAIANIQAGIASLITTAQTASGGDLRMSVITFKDTVDVDQPFTTVVGDVLTAVGALSASGGGGGPEASDQGLRVAITDTSACGPTGVQGAFRPECLNVAIMMTDNEPGGCDDTYTAGVDDVEADAVANLAAAAGIQIVAVRVGTGANPVILQNYATVSGGLYTEVPSNGAGLAASIESILGNCVPVSCGDDVTNGGCTTGTVGAPCAADADCDTSPAAGDGSCLLEECDGTDDGACPGLCRAPGDPNGGCTCAVCGDGVVDPGENCDNGVNNGACSQAAGCQDPSICPVACDFQVACTVDGDCPLSENWNVPGFGPLPASTCENGSCQVHCANNSYCRGLPAGNSASLCAGVPTCNGTCSDVESMCEKMGPDPATIKFGKDGKPDRLSIHAFFTIKSEMDPIGEGFTIRITNANGLVYEGSLLSGDLKADDNKGKRFSFRDRTARDGGQHAQGGLEKVSLKRRVKGGELQFTFKVRAYGDMSAATQAFMMTQVRIGDDGAVLSSVWRQTKKGWKLRHADFF